MNNNIDEVLQSVFENSSDPDDACERVSALYQPHDLKLCHPRDQLRAQMKHRDVRDTSLSRLLYNAEIQIDSEPFKDFYLVMLPSSGHCSTLQPPWRVLAGECWPASACWRVLAGECSLASARGRVLADECSPTSAAK